MAKHATKEEVLSRLKNIKGHITGIERMVQEEQTCNNILMQLSAIRSSIEKVGIFILENNALECVSDNREQTLEDKQKMENAIKQIITFLK